MFTEPNLSIPRPAGQTMKSPVRLALSGPVPKTTESGSTAHLSIPRFSVLCMWVRSK